MKDNITLKSFRINLVLKVLLLSVFIFLFAYFAVTLGIDLITGLFIIPVIYQIISIIKYIDRTNRELVKFLESIKYSDFTQKFSFQNLGGSFKELNISFNDVLERFKEARKEKEESARYLQTVVQHIGIGLISFYPDGEVNLINNAAKKLFKVNSLKNVKQLESLSKDLVSELLNLKPGKRGLVKFVSGNNLYQLVLFSTEFKMQDKVFKFVSVQNIWFELEEKEAEAWHKLISVLTHEIMNSITPISSIAQTLKGLINQKVITTELLDDLKTGIDTIQRRSEGLISFVNNYRTLSKIPVANFAVVPVKKLLNDVYQLMEKQITEKGISFKINVDPEVLELTIDQKLIEQVLINMILNAIDAVKQKEFPSISLKAFISERGTPVIQVIDNGTGIITDVQDKIFIPFYTTKQTGSGIGLSLAKQIMRQHSGNISFVSVPDEETVFTLFFSV